MKSRRLTCITMMMLLAALAIPVGLAALADAAQPKHHHYQITDIGTFGGPSSYFNSLSLSDRFGFVCCGFFSFAQMFNKRGILAGWAETSTPDPYAAFCYTPDCFAAHAFRWQQGVKSDLGALPGGASSAAFWINSDGLVVGNSENGITDPLIPGFPEVRAVLWNQGKIIDLGTLGGNQSFAEAVNDRNQIVGVALNVDSDTFSFYDLFVGGSSNGTQTRAVLWDHGIIQDLGTLGGFDAAAFLVNQRGQVAGFSYTNSIPNPDDGLPTIDPFLWDPNTGMKDLGNFGDLAASVNGLNNQSEVVGGLYLSGDQQIHPFLWDGKKLIDLVAPPFGGPGNGEASWINEAGEVVGLAGVPKSCPPGSPVGPIQQAFLWRNGVMKDLGSLPGSPNSEGDFINSRSQIVGLSWTCDFSFTAFLWENGSMVDLNALVPANSPFLFAASSIDDRGAIVALGALPDGATHAMLLIPCDKNHADMEGCDYSLVDAAPQSNPASVVQRLSIPPKPAMIGRGMMWPLGVGRVPGLRTLGPGTGPAN
jgi:probable HAF family extracellular repeat protein